MQSFSKPQPAPKLLEKTLVPVQLGRKVNVPYPVVPVEVDDDRAVVSNPDLFQQTGCRRGEEVYDHGAVVDVVVSCWATENDLDICQRHSLAYPITTCLAARNTMSRKTVMPARSSATSWFAGIRLAAADRRELSLPEFLWQVFSLNRGIRHRRGKSWHSQLFDKCLMPFELARDLRQLVV